MAIDASIALKGQVPKVDMPGMIGQAQTIRNAQMAEQTARAQLPGIQAEAAAKDREERARKFIEANKGKYSRIDPKTGTRKYDERAMANALGEQGFGEFSQAFFAKAAANEAADIQNSTSEQELAEKKMAFGKARVQDAANLIRTLPPGEQAAALKKWREGTRATIGDYADTVFDEAFGREAPPQAVPGVPGAAPVNRAELVSRATISPEQQVQNDLTRNSQRQTDVSLGQSAESIAQAGAAGGVGAAERNPSSAISQSLRAQAAEQGFQIPPTLNAAQVRLLPGFKERVQSAIPSAETRTSLQVEAGDISAAAGAVRGASSVAGQLTVKYGRPDSITRKTWNTLVEQSPQYAEVQSQIDAYNAANPGSKLDILDGFSAIKRRLDIYAKELEKKAGVRTSISANPSGLSNPAPQPAAKAEPAPAPSIKVGDIRSIGGVPHVFTGGNPKVRSSWKPK